jgi:hypothetical protein
MLQDRVASSLKVFCIGEWISVEWQPDDHDLTFSIEESRSLGCRILVAHLVDLFGQQSWAAEELKTKYHEFIDSYISDRKKDLPLRHRNHDASEQRKRTSDPNSGDQSGWEPEVK